MPNFIEIGGVTRKPLVDLTWNDPVAKKTAAKEHVIIFCMDAVFGPCQMCVLYQNSYINVLFWLKSTLNI